MKRILTFLAAAALLFALSACKNESNANNNTSTSTTSTSATDTSSTTSTTDTSGTSGTSGTPGTTATTSTTGSAMTPLNDADRKFVETVAEGNSAEVALGNLGAQKGSNADVKSFANRMITDHSKANDELKQLAANKGLSALATEPNKKDKDEADKLSKESGAKFDKAFMTGMVKGHTEVVSLFEKESKDAKDPDLKAWVDKTLPTIQDHLKMAKEINGKLK